MKRGRAKKVLFYASKGVPSVTARSKKAGHFVVSKIGQEPLLCLCLSPVGKKGERQRKGLSYTCVTFNKNRWDSVKAKPLRSRRRGKEGERKEEGRKRSCSRKSEFGMRMARCSWAKWMVTVM